MDGVRQQGPEGVNLWGLPAGPRPVPTLRHMERAGSAESPGPVRPLKVAVFPFNLGEEREASGQVSDVLPSEWGAARAEQAATTQQLGYADSWSFHGSFPPEVLQWP